MAGSFFSLVIVRKGAAAYKWNEWVHLDYVT